MHDVGTCVCCRPHDLMVVLEGRSTVRPSCSRTRHLMGDTAKIQDTFNMSKLCFMQRYHSFHPHNMLYRYSVACFGCFLLYIARVHALVPPGVISTSSSSTGSGSSSTPAPVVLSIAGSDSGGGAGIQADLHAIHSFGCHGCTAITCVTAQNSIGVSAVHEIPPAFLREQLHALDKDFSISSIKIGMVFSSDNAKEIANFLASYHEKEKQRPWIVCDPVMISTSGSALISAEAKRTMIEEIFPYVDVLTPNKFEAEELLGKKLRSFADVEQGAREILDTMKVASVLIKGGHLADDDAIPSSFSQDYFLSQSTKRDSCSDNTSQEEQRKRLCDGNDGVWLRGPRINSTNTHGTGCTLSSSIAAALALGRQKCTNSASTYNTGSSAIDDVLDACCLAKAYVTAGIDSAVQIGKGPGPVAHTLFPSSHKYYPSVAFDPNVKDSQRFLQMDVSSSSPVDTLDSTPPAVLSRIIPIVNSLEWIKKLSSIPGIMDIQLRLKGTKQEDIEPTIREAQDYVSKHCEGLKRLWINDYWKEAIAGKCYGVHLGQEDLAACVAQGGIEILRRHNIALGVSSHTYAELSVAMSVQPSYISLGPVFGTTSKNVKFGPQGLTAVSQWRSLIPPNIPLVAIGGIGDEQTAKLVKMAGADSVAVIGAITKAKDIEGITQQLLESMG